MKKTKSVSDNLKRSIRKLEFSRIQLKKEIEENRFNRKVQRKRSERASTSIPETAFAANKKPKSNDSIWEKVKKQRVTRKKEAKRKEERDKNRDPKTIKSKPFRI